MKKLKLGILGTGYLGKIIAKAWKDGLLEDYELVGMSGRNEKYNEEAKKEFGCPVFKSLDELLSLKPDYIAEAASVGAVKDGCENILKNKTNFVVLSIGAFADKEFYNSMKELARENGVRIYIASGAVGGFDALRTMCLMGRTKAKMEVIKKPEKLQNTPLYSEKLMSSQEKITVFDKTAKEAIEILPTQVNVAVATALSSTGADEMEVVINSLKGFQGNRHIVTAETEGASAEFNFFCEKSAVAGWSAVAVLRNITSPVVF